MAELQLLAQQKQSTVLQAGQQLPEQLPGQLHLKVLQKVLRQAPHTNLGLVVVMAKAVLLLCLVLQQVPEQPVCLQQPGQLPKQLQEKADRSQAVLPIRC